MGISEKKTLFLPKPTGLRRVGTKQWETTTIFVSRQDMMIQRMTMNKHRGLASASFHCCQQNKVVVTATPVSGSCLRLGHWHIYCSRTYWVIFTTGSKANNSTSSGEPSRGTEVNHGVKPAEHDRDANLFNLRFVDDILLHRCKHDVSGKSARDGELWSLPSPQFSEGKAPRSQQTSAAAGPGHHTVESAGNGGCSSARSSRSAAAATHKTLPFRESEGASDSADAAKTSGSWPNRPNFATQCFGCRADKRKEVHITVTSGT